MEATEERGYFLKVRKWVNSRVAITRLMCLNLKPKLCDMNNTEFYK